MAKDFKHDVQTVTGELDIEDVTAGTWEEKPTSSVLGTYKRLLKSIEIEPTPGSYAPGRWSNAGSCSIVYSWGTCLS